MWGFKRMGIVLIFLGLFIAVGFGIFSENPPVRDPGRTMNVGLALGKELASKMYQAGPRSSMAQPAEPYWEPLRPPRKKTG